MNSRPSRAASRILTGVLSLVLAFSGSPAGARESGTPVPFPTDPTGLPPPGQSGADSPRPARSPGPFPPGPAGRPAAGQMGAEIDEPAGYQAQAACVAAALPGTVK